MRVLSAAKLTGLESAKDVRHVVIDLTESGLTYEPGDSIGLLTPNDPALVEVPAHRPRRHRRGACPLP